MPEELPFDADVEIERIELRMEQGRKRVEYHDRAREAVRRPGILHAVFSIEELPYYEEFATEAAFRRFVADHPGNIGAYHR